MLDVNTQPPSETFDVAKSNLSKMTYMELEEIIAAAKERQQSLKAVAINDKRAQIEKELAEIGLSLNDLVQLPKKGAKGAKKGGAVVARYRDPNNPENTWSGRGKPRKWLAELIAQGRDKEEFRIGT